MNFLLAAVGMGDVLGNATNSIGAYMKYLPEALLAAVVIAFGFIWLQKKKASAGPSVGGLGGGQVGASQPNKGGSGGSTNLMLVYSHVQRRVVGIRPFAVERKKDISGNILEKRAVYLDTKSQAGLGKLDNVFALLGRMFGRKPAEKPIDEQEGVLFTEDLAIGSPGGGWIASITLEENAQIPIFPDVSTNNESQKEEKDANGKVVRVKVDTTAYLKLAEEIKRINSQYDKRISRLKDAALSINQYASSANSQMKQLFGKELMIFGVLVLMGILILAYMLGQLGNSIALAGQMMSAATKAAVP